MTEENVRLIREGYDAMARGDFEWVKEHAHPDLEFESASARAARRAGR